MRPVWRNARRPDRTSPPSIGLRRARGNGLYPRRPSTGLSRALLLWEKNLFITDTPAGAFTRYSGNASTKHILTPAQSAAILTSTKAIYPNLLPWLLFKRYTGVRTSELRQLEWGHITAQYMRVPADISKSKRDRLVPLRPLFQELIQSLRGTGRISPLRTGAKEMARPNLCRRPGQLRAQCMERQLYLISTGRNAEHPPDSGRDGKYGLRQHQELSETGHSRNGHRILERKQSVQVSCKISAPSHTLTHLAPPRPTVRTHKLKPYKH